MSVLSRELQLQVRGLTEGGESAGEEGPEQGWYVLGLGQQTRPDDRTEREGVWQTYWTDPSGCWQCGCPQEGSAGHCMVVGKGAEGAR